MNITKRNTISNLIIMFISSFVLLEMYGYNWVTLSIGITLNLIYINFISDVWYNFMDNLSDKLKAQLKN